MAIPRNIGLNPMTWFSAKNEGPHISAEGIKKELAAKREQAAEKRSVRNELREDSINTREDAKERIEEAKENYEDTKQEKVESLKWDAAYVAGAGILLAVFPPAGIAAMIVAGGKAVNDLSVLGKAKAEQIKESMEARAEKKERLAEIKEMRNQLRGKFTPEASQEAVENQDKVLDQINANAEKLLAAQDAAAKVGEGEEIQNGLSLVKRRGTVAMVMPIPQAAVETAEEKAKAEVDPKERAAQYVVEADGLRVNQDIEDRTLSASAVKELSALQREANKNAVVSPELEGARTRNAIEQAIHINQVSKGKNAITADGGGEKDLGVIGSLMNKANTEGQRTIIQTGINKANMLAELRSVRPANENDKGNMNNARNLQPVITGSLTGKGQAQEEAQKNVGRTSTPEVGAAR